MICFSCSWSFAHLKFSWYSSARLKDHTGTTQCQQGYKWDDTTSKAIPYRAEFTYLARIWTVSDPGEGPGRSGPPSYFYTKLRPEGPKKKFLETGPSLHLRIWMTAPPPLPVWRSGSATNWSTSRAHYPLQESCKKLKYLIFWLVDYITSFIIYREQN